MFLFVTFLVIFVLQRLIASLASSRSRSSASTDDDAVISGIAQDTRNNTATKQHYKTVLLCGPVGAGKTMLFHRVTSSNDGTAMQMTMTLSSMIAAQGTYVSNANGEDSNAKDVHVHIVDYPGHARLRSSLLSNAVIGSGTGQSQLSLSLSGIIFVLDSTRPNMAESADLLYDVLLQIQRTRPIARIKAKASFRVLICCNKSDMKLAKNEKRIQLQLKTELNRLRGTRGAIESTDNGLSGSTSRSADSNNASVLGKPGVPLDWSMDGGMPCEVSFVSCSCLDDNYDGLKGVRDFIEGVC